MSDPRSLGVRAHGLYGDKGIPLARRPHVIGEPVQGDLIAASPDHSYESLRVFAGQGAERQGRLAALAPEIGEGLPKSRDVGQLLLASGHHEEKGLVDQPAPDERNQTGAHLVGPVQILEHAEQRLSPGQISEQLGHALKDQAHICCGRRGRGAPQDVGHEARELCTDRGREPRRQLRVIGQMAGAKRIDPGPEWQDLLRLVRAPDQDCHPATGRVVRELADEATLPDSRLSEHRNDPTGPAGRAGELRAQLLDLLRAPDELCLATRRLPFDEVRRRSRPRACRCDGSARPLPKNLLVEDLGHRLRLDPELALEHADTMLVLAQRGLAPAGVGVEPHQRPVDRLLERIEREELQRRLHGRIGRSALSMVDEEAGEDFEGQLSQALPFAHEPLLEGRLGERESGK